MSWREDPRLKLAANAAAIWLVGGTLALLIDGGASRLFSLRAAAFLGLGVFAAAALVGGASYFIGNAMASRLVARFPDPASAEAQSSLRGWRAVFGIMNTAIAILFLLCAYAAVFWYWGEG
jgi:hypothetical protein